MLPSQLLSAGNQHTLRLESCCSAKLTQHQLHRQLYVSLTRHCILESCCHAAAHRSSRQFFPRSPSVSVPHQPSRRHCVELKLGHLCCNEVERSLLQAAQRQGTVSQEVARQTDGVLLAVGALSSVLKKKVSKETYVCLGIMHHASSGHYCNSPGSGPLMVTRNQMLHDTTVHATHAQWPFLSLQAPYKNQLEGLLLNNVMPCFDSPYGHLRAKACWVAGQYADIDFREGSGQGHTFNSLFQKVVNAFQDPDLPVGTPL